MQPIVGKTQQIVKQPHRYRGPKSAKWLSPGHREQPFRESRERTYRLRGGNGGTPDTRDAATGPTGPCTTHRATGDHTAGTTGTGCAGRATGNGTGCALRSCRATGAAGNHSAGATGTGLTTGPTGDHTTGTTRTGLTDRATGDRHIGAARACGTHAGARCAIGVPARRRSGLCTGDRGKRDGRPRSTGEHKCRHLRQFHHHVGTVTTGVAELNILKTQTVDDLRRSVWCTSAAAAA